MHDAGVRHRRTRCDRQSSAKSTAATDDRAADRALDAPTGSCACDYAGAALIWLGCHFFMRKTIAANRGHGLPTLLSGLVSSILR